MWNGVGVRGTVLHVATTSFNSEPHSRLGWALVTVRKQGNFRPRTHLRMLLSSLLISKVKGWGELLSALLKMAVFWENCVFILLFSTPKHWKLVWGRRDFCAGDLTHALLFPRESANSSAPRKHRKAQNASERGLCFWGWVSVQAVLAPLLSHQPTAP